MGAEDLPLLAADSNSLQLHLYQHVRGTIIIVIIITLRHHGTTALGASNQVLVDRLLILTKTLPMPVRAHTRPSSHTHTHIHTHVPVASHRATSRW